MKKFFAFIIAVTLAVGFSAFTTINQKTTTYYWVDDGSNWHTIDGSEVCTPGSHVVCTEDVGFPYGVRTIYNSQSTSDPLLKD